MPGQIRRAATSSTTGARCTTAAPRTRRPWSSVGHGTGLRDARREAL